MTLSAALKTRDDITAQLKPYDLRIAKLEALVRSSSPAVAEKSALHSDHAHRLKTWVANGDDNELPPVLDADRLQALETQILGHEASKAAAGEGLRVLIAARSGLVDEHKTANAAAHYAAVDHAISEMLPEMIARFNEAHKALTDAKDRIDNAYRYLMAEGTRLANTSYNSRAERLWAEVKAKQVTPVSREDFTLFHQRVNELLSPASVEAI